MCPVGVKCVPATVVNMSAGHKHVGPPVYNRRDPQTLKNAHKKKKEGGGGCLCSYNNQRERNKRAVRQGCKTGAEEECEEEVKECIHAFGRLRRAQAAASPPPGGVWRVCKNRGRLMGLNGGGAGEG